MALPFYNVIVTFYRTNFANGNQVLIFAVKGFMYPAGAAENIVLPLGPDPAILTYFHIVIDGPAVNPDLVRLEPGHELDVTMLSPSAFGFGGRWRVQSDSMPYSGGQDFNNLDNVDITVKRVVA